MVCCPSLPEKRASRCGSNMCVLALRCRIAYGPVHSRRLGLSLGINILPAHRKVCNFNCPYCQYGWTRSPQGARESWPAASAVGVVVSRRLRRARAQGEIFDRLTLAGHGEPTLHPQFADIVRRVRRARDRHAPGTRLAVLSNSSTVGIPSVRAALLELDDRYMKLDAGDPVTLRRMNASPVTFARIVEGLRTLPAIVIQAMFVCDPLGRIDNSGDAAVDAWLQALSRIRPAAVHIYTVDRAPACFLLRRVPDPRLLEVAERVQKIGIPAQAFLSDS